MEIPEINMISDFEAGMQCLQNPSLISRFFSFPGIAEVIQVYTFWKWGALIFAIFATFSSIIKKIKLIFIRFHTIKPSLHQNEEVEFSEDDDISLASSDDEREEDEDDDDDEEEEESSSSTTSFRSQQSVDENFCVKGSSLCLKKHWQNSQLRQRRRRISGGERFDWSDFTSGKNVVKLWDSLSLSFKFGEDFSIFNSNDVVSRWDCFDGYQKSNEFCACAPASNIPAVVLTAERNENRDGVVLRGYDTRMRSSVSAFSSEWRSAAAAEVEVSNISAGGIGKVYVRDDVNGVLTVGDVRNVRVPLENARDFDDDTWWDADAVMVEDDYVLVDKSS